MATAPKSTTSKKITPSVVTETAEKLEKVAVEAKDQAIETIEESKEKLEVEAKQLSDTVQEQLRQFKHFRFAERINRIEKLYQDRIQRCR